MACGGDADTKALLQELLVRLSKVQGNVEAILERMDDPEADHGMEETEQEDVGEEMGDAEDEPVQRPAAPVSVGAFARFGGGHRRVSGKR